MKVVNVVLSGGVGSRLWPLSSKERPKQYLPIFEGETLFQKTVLRNKDYCDELLVVGNKDNYQLSRKDLENFPSIVLGEIIEASPRNTAAAIAFAAFSCSEEDILFVTPSDHLIESGEVYEKAIQSAFDLAEKGNIVTFGLKPTYAETGFGYIEHQGNEVIGFREKPNKELAQQYLDKGNFLWNSGMFCFKAGVFLQELKSHASDIFDASKRTFAAQQEGFLDEALSMTIPSVSVDYAVMEKSNKIKVVPAAFKWSDMGSFASIFDYLQSKGHPVDQAGNMYIGEEKKYVEFLGLSDTILVQTKEAILAVHKDAVQEVKGIYEKLEKGKKND